MRYFLHIAYNGTNYHGWQRQREAISVREVFEKCMEQALKQPVECIGCGRTDSFVHASQYFFHFDVSKEIDFDLVFRLNKMLPRDLSVFDIFMVADKAHARFDAILRTYDYFLHTYKDPFLNERSSFYLEPNLDVSKMNDAIKILEKYNDFRGFCLTPEKQNNTLCTIASTKLFVNEKSDRIRFQITSNRFLRGMIRIIMSRLLDIGTQKLSLTEFESFLQRKEAIINLKPAYPQGLYLSKVTYPYLDIEPKHSFDDICSWIKV